jgi:cytochrome c553
MSLIVTLNCVRPPAAALVAALLIATLCAGCKGEGSGGIRPDTAPADIWKTTCSRCHGFSGEGTQRLGRPIDMRDPTWQASKTDAELEDTIRKGKRNDRGGIMESYESRLSDAQIQGLIRHIRDNIGKPPAR